MKEFSEKELRKNDFRTVFIKSNIPDQILVIHYNKQIDNIKLSIHNNKPNQSIFTLVKYLYSLMFFGVPYIDQISLDRKQLNELKLFITNIDRE